MTQNDYISGLEQVVSLVCGKYSELMHKAPYTLKREAVDWLEQVLLPVLEKYEGEDCCK